MLGVRAALGLQKQLKETRIEREQQGTQSRDAADLTAEPRAMKRQKLEQAVLWEEATNTQYLSKRVHSHLG